MKTTRSALLELLLQDLSQAFPVASFLRALGEPPELAMAPASDDFWHGDLRMWIREDYGARLERVLHAYKSLRPEDLSRT